MARFFNGGTDRVSSPGGWSSATGCIGGRLKTTQTTSNVAVFSIWTTSTRNGVGLILNNSAGKLLGYTPGPSGSTASVNSTVNVNDGTWHSFLYNFATASGAANELFIDGASQGTANNTGAWAFDAFTQGIFAGDNNDNFWGSYVGDLAELAVWDRKLTVDEAVAFSQGLTAPHIAPDNLQFYAPLVRDVAEREGNFPLSSVIGGSVSDHPRVLGAIL